MTKYWVGGAGIWDNSDTSHWSTSSGGSSGAAVPGSSDDVVLDGASGGGTIDIAAILGCLSISGGAFTGTLKTNDYPLTLGTFNFSGTGARTLNLGSSSILITGSSTTVFNITTATNLTLLASNAIITCSGNFITFTGNSGKTYGSVIFTGGDTPNVNASTFGTINRQSGGTGLKLLGDMTINNLIYNNQLGSRTITVTAGKTITIPTAEGFQVSGLSSKLMSMISSSAGTPWNLSIPSGIVSSDYLSLQDSRAQGSVPFYAGSHSVNVSNNLNWLFQDLLKRGGNLGLLGV